MYILFIVKRNRVRMKEIVKILMERDEISKEEATAMVKQARASIFKCLDRNDQEGAESVLMEQLGLENDYLFNIL